MRSLDPEGYLAMRGNRHPITHAGFGYFIHQWKFDMERALRHGDCQIIGLGDEVFKGRPSIVVEAVFASRDGRKYYCSRGVVHIDKRLMLPLGYAHYDENGKPFEIYSYSNVKLNIGLTDKDFSRKNKAYHF